LTEGANRVLTKGRQRETKLASAEQRGVVRGRSP